MIIVIFLLVLIDNIVLVAGVGTHRIPPNVTDVTGPCFQQLLSFRCGTLQLDWCVIKDFDEANQDENPQTALQNPPQQGAADKLGLVANGKPVQVGFHNALGKPCAF